MKVYIVVGIYQYEGGEVLSVYHSREAAEQAIKQFAVDYEQYEKDRKTMNYSDEFYDKWEDIPARYDEYEIEEREVQ